MGKRSVKDNKNVWQMSREAAGLTREAAEERLTFVSADRIERIACDHHMAWAEGVKPTGKEAFILTEYGGIAFEQEGDEAGAWGYHDKVENEEDFFARFGSLMDALRAIPYCQGYCYTQLTDVMQEINGLLTPDRKPKVDIERFAALNRNPVGRNG